MINIEKPRLKCNNFTYTEEENYDENIITNKRIQCTGKNMHHEIIVQMMKDLKKK